MPQDREYIVHFKDGSSKTYPPAPLGARPEDLKRHMDSIKSDAAMEGMKRGGIGRPDQTRQLGGLPVEVQRGEGLNPASALGVDLPPNDPDVLSAIKTGANRIGHATSIASGLSPMTLPLRMLGAGAGGLLSALTSESEDHGLLPGLNPNPITSGLIDAGMELANPLGAKMVKGGVKVGAAFGGMSNKRARQQLADAHLREWQRFPGLGIPVGGGVRPIAKLVDMLPRAIREPLERRGLGRPDLDMAEARMATQGEKLNKIEEAITEPVTGRSLRGAVREEVNKPSDLPVTNAVRGLGEEEEVLLQNALRSRLERGGKKLGDFSEGSEELARRYAEARGKPFKARRKLIDKTKFTGREVGDLKRVSQQRASDIIAERSVKAGKFINDDISAAGHAARARRLKKAQEGAARRTDRKNALTKTIRPSVTNAPVTPKPTALAPIARRRTVEVEPPHKMLPGRRPIDRAEPPLKAKFGATSPVKITGDRLAEVKKARRKGTAITKAQPAGPLGTIPTKVIKGRKTNIEGALKETNQRLSDLHKIKGAKDALRGGGTFLTDLGSKGIEGGFIHGVGSNMSRAWGVQMNPLLYTAATLLGILRPSNISRVGMWAGRATQGTPTGVRLAHTGDEEQKRTARRKKIGDQRKKGK